MARSKSVSDEEILGATVALVAEHGTSMTLTHIGERVGLSAATVVQRFGSRRRLLAEAVSHWGRTRPVPAQDGFACETDRLFAIVETILLGFTSHTQVSNIQSMIHLAIRDDDFRSRLQVAYGRQREWLRRCLEAAVKTGELKPCDPARMAATIQIVVYGALSMWSIEPDGDLLGCIRGHFDAVVEPLRT